MGMYIKFEQDGKQKVQEKWGKNNEKGALKR